MMQEASSKFKRKVFRFIFNQSVRKQKDKEKICEKFRRNVGDCFCFGFIEMPRVVSSILGTLTDATIEAGLKEAFVSNFSELGKIGPEKWKATV